MELQPQYISNKSDNIAENGYNAGNPMQSLSQWFGRQVDMNVLKEKWQETDPVTGFPFNWNHSYHNNPYWTLNKMTNSRNRDRMIGNMNFAWRFTDWLSLRATAGTDWYIEDIMERGHRGMLMTRLEVSIHIRTAGRRSMQTPGWRLLNLSATSPSMKFGGR